MEIAPIRTRALEPPQDDLKAVLDESLTGLRERDIVMITSKVVAIDQGRCVKQEGADRDALTRAESDQVVEVEHPPYRFLLAVKHGTIFAYAGIDDSNSQEYYVLPPERPFAAAEEVGRHLRERHGVKEFGVVITDSHLTPLRRGVTGTSVGFWGIEPLRDYRGTPDIFGHLLEHTQTNIPDSLASICSMVMGEGDEQTPVAVVSNPGNVDFTDRPTGPRDIEIPLEEDLFAPFLRKFGEKS
ncbi:MAG: coenzyme F420-0:L-glutamate ligase [Patescibacteria group bacterium]